MPIRNLYRRFTSAVGRMLGVRANSSEAAPVLNASYDSARSGPMDAHWAHADNLDADSAHSPDVREKLRNRSRYESESNGYYAGSMRTHATAVVGSAGPTLRMQTKNEGFNQQVEREWYEWCKAVQLRRKLWSAVVAWKKDGETFGILQFNKRLKTAVKLDVVFLETDHCATPSLPFARNRIDGIHLDEAGNVIGYDILPTHPGSGTFYQSQKPEFVAAKNVLHIFSLERPGQHRGVPACSSTLNVGAGSRRFREATVVACEVFANHTSVLYTDLPTNTDEAPANLEAMSTLPTMTGMQTVLPRGWKQDSFKSDQPVTGYSEFVKQTVAEQARPLGQPHSIAACDASDANFSSLKTNHLTYYAQVAVDRADLNDLCLERLFEQWWLEREAIRKVDREVVESRFIPPHEFVWPVQPSADRQADAAAEDIKLRNGTLTYDRACSDQGLDAEDEIAANAARFGITTDEMRRVLLFTYFPAAAQALNKPEPAAPASPPGDDTEMEDVDALDTTIA